MDKNDYAIKVDNLYKSFLLPHNKSTSLKEAAIDHLKRQSGSEHHQALKGVSFAVEHGEFFGITGRNGSGKSTLMRILAGVYTPTSGGVHISGKLVPFIELGVGFNPDLTGRDNVFLNGSLLGFSRKEMAAMYDDIVEFAELEQFMSQKLKNYSSGMQVRLAFSIAIRAKGDILLLDEVLAVGDSAFQKKCFKYFDEIKDDSSQTVVFVTHSMESLQKYCDRAIMLKDGQVVEENTSARIAARYHIENLPARKPTPSQEEVDQEAVHVQTVKVNGEKNTVVDAEEEVELLVRLRAPVQRRVHSRLALRRDDGTLVSELSTHEAGAVDLGADSAYTLRYRVQPKQLKPGAYFVDVGVEDENGTELATRPDSARFAVQSAKERTNAQVTIQGAWEL